MKKIWGSGSLLEAFIAVVILEFLRGLLGKSLFTRALAFQLDKHVDLFPRWLLLALSFALIVLVVWAVNKLLHKLFGLLVPIGVDIFWDRLWLRKLRKENNGKLPFEDKIAFERMSGPKEKAAAVRTMLKAFAPGSEHETKEITQSAVILAQFGREKPSIADAGYPSDILQCGPQADLSEFDKELNEIPWPEIRDAMRNSFRYGIVLKTVCPPDFTANPTTFFGGLPVATPSLDWPSFVDRDGNLKYCNFIGQIDCATLPEFGLSNALPKDGILYFFADQTEEYDALSQNENGLVVFQVHSEDLQEIQPPGPFAPNCWNQHDVPKIWEWELSHPNQPSGSIFPKWEMSPQPVLQPDPSDAAYSRLLNKHKTAEEQAKALGYTDAYDLIASVTDKITQKTTSTIFGAAFDYPPLSQTNDQGNSKGYDGFPSNWLAVDMVIAVHASNLKRVCKTAQKALDAPIYQREQFDDHEKFETALAAQKWHKEKATKRLANSPALREELNTWRQTATKNGLDTPLLPTERTKFWALWEHCIHFETEYRLQTKASLWALNRAIDTAVSHCSLNAMVTSSETHAALPQNVVDYYTAALAANPYAEGPFSGMGNKHQILGAPTPTQGNDDWWADICLLQVDTDAAFGWKFGDANVLQYWISADALMAQEFSSAEATIG